MKRVVSLLLAGVMTTTAFAVDIDEKIKQIRQQAYEEGYKKGWLDSELKNKEKWVREGEERILKRLKLYGELLDRIFNYEVLLKDGRILPPQVALICDKPVIDEDEYREMSCAYKIVVPARFVNPKNLTFENLIEKGEIENLVKPVDSKPIIDRVYLVGVFDYDVGLEVVEKLYQMGLRTIQRNIQGKLAVAVFETSLTAEKKEKLQREFRLKKISLQDFMASRFIVRKQIKQIKKPEKKMEKQELKPKPEYRGVVKAYGLRIREYPSVSSRTIGWLRKGDTVLVIDKTGKWYRVSVKGKTGYVYARYIKLEGI
ncbi:SH3 domain-containing protein [Persephonella sp.]